MITVGHAPSTVKKTLLWLMLEAGIDKYALTELITQRGCYVTINMLRNWEKSGDKRDYAEWVQFSNTLNGILNQYGMKLQDFHHDIAYTPLFLSELQERSGLSDYRMANELGISPLQLDRYKSIELQHTKRLSFNQINNFVAKNHKILSQFVDDKINL